MEPLLIIAAVLALGAAYVLFPVALATYRQMRSPRFVICPETERSAEIELGGVRAGLGSAIGASWLRVTACGRWPARKGCDQRCLEGVDTRWAEDHWLLVRQPAAGDSSEAR